MKLKEGKVLSEFQKNKNRRCERDIIDLFNTRCMLKSKKDEQDKSGYIRHLYDISWKCALTRTIDLFGIPEEKTRKDDCQWLTHYDEGKEHKMIEALHGDNAIGRELHSIALEFYMFDSENPFDILVHIYFLLKNIKNNQYKKWIRAAERIIREMDKSKRHEIRERRVEKISSKYLFNKKFDKNTRCFAELINKEEYLSIVNYINSYCKKDDVIKHILNRITCVHNKEKINCDKNLSNNAARCFKMLLISRHTAGGFYAMKEEGVPDFTSKEYSPASLLKGESYWFWPWPEEQQGEDATKDKKCIYPAEDFKYSNVSGRYDAISFVKARQMRRCSFPHFETKNKNSGLDDYSFPSILTRREFGIKIDLRPCGDCTPHKKRNESGNELAGYISVTLKRRALRLPFLARLLAAVDKDDKVMQPEGWLGTYLQDTDTALLLDGSADFLLVLRMEKKPASPESEEQEKHRQHRLRRTGHVIDMAYWLYQDFMVDRTEFILSAAVLDDVAEEIARNQKSEFSLECEIRCFEDRLLDKTIHSFKKQLETGIANSKGDVSLLVTIKITAGRKDFLLRFFPPVCCVDKAEECPCRIVPNATEWKFYRKTNDEKTGFRAALAELLDKGDILFVDRIEVNVNKRPPK